MATATGFTAARMLLIEASTVVGGVINSLGHLILQARDGSEIDAGSVVGPQGPTGPTGSIVDYGGDSAPDGWLLCQGQAISRTTYADLFAVLGTKFGSGNGTTTFNVPDYRDSTSIGKGTTYPTVGASAGSNTVTLTANQSGLRSHAHTQVAHNHAFTINIQHSDGTATSAESLTSGLQQGGRSRYNGATVSATPGINSVAAANASEAHSVVQKSVVVNKIIKI